MNTDQNIQTASVKHSFLTVCFTAIFLVTSFVSGAQMRKFSLIYSENLKGGTTLFGNTLLCLKNVSNEGVETIADTSIINSNRYDGNSIYGNDYNYMGNVDIDGNTAEGSTTRNSSSADLILPAGNNSIKLARIYWGGRVADSDFNLNLSENKKIKIRKGNSGNYTDVAALHIDKATIIEGYTEYQAYADITGFITKNGKGTYTAANVPLSTGAIENGGNNGGWCIVVVFENPILNYSSVRVYDGFEKVFNDGSPVTTAVTLTGLDVPSGNLSPEDAKMGVMTWEGDANLYGDFLKINGNYFSNQTNQYYNPWNGTITNSGVHITTKNPDFTNQMGIDIDMFDAGLYGIEPNATSVNLEFGTEADQYYPGLFTFSIRMKDPAMTLQKTVQDANSNNMAEAGEILTYTLKGKNTGTGNANGITIVDTLPNTVTYFPNSLKVISSPGVTVGSKTDAQKDDVAEFIPGGIYNSVVFRVGRGADQANGGSLARNETYEVQFQVKVKQPPAGETVSPIMNIARIHSNSDANIIFVDDGTAIINPVAGAMPVRLEKFEAAILEEQVELNWITSMEINCKQFLIERSTDGNSFTEIARVEGNGTTSSYHRYFYKDDVSSIASAVVFYRLKQMDADGKFQFSKVISIKPVEKNKEISVSPNPFSDFLTIKLNWPQSETVTEKILTAGGNELFSEKISLQKGPNVHKLYNLSFLPKGTYFIQFISSEKKVTEKITK